MPRQQEVTKRMEANTSTSLKRKSKRRASSEDTSPQLPAPHVYRSVNTPERIGWNPNRTSTLFTSHHSYSHNTSRHRYDKTAGANSHRTPITSALTRRTTRSISAPLLFDIHIRVHELAKVYVRTPALTHLQESVIATIASATCVDMSERTRAPKMKSKPNCNCFHKPSLPFA